MRIIKLSLLLIFLLVTANAIAQEEVLHGKITNETDVEGIHILNTTSRFNTVTDGNGNFSIEVNKLDTLLISSIKYIPKKITISEEDISKGIIIIQLTELVIELEEVNLGPNLTGNLATDLKNIKTEKKIDFDDVGIPGFKGKPQEKIVPIVAAFFPTNINIEAVYKYMSGYYKKLKIQRKWEGQNTSAAVIMNFYPEHFLKEAYEIPDNRSCDFILFCVETSSLSADFKNENYTKVLIIFKDKSQEYLSRLKNKKE